MIPLWEGPTPWPDTPGGALGVWRGVVGSHLFSLGRLLNDELVGEYSAY